jgi:hypothetical protein
MSCSLASAAALAGNAGRLVLANTPRTHPETTELNAATLGGC